MAEISAQPLEAGRESVYKPGPIGEAAGPSVLVLANGMMVDHSKIVRPIDPSPRAAFWGRLLLAHVLCYPLLFAVAMATLSLAIIRTQARLLEVTGTADAASGFQRWLVRELGLSLGDAARFEIVIQPVGIALAVVFVVMHVASLPWALAAAREARSRGTPAAEAARTRLHRTQRWWLGASLGLTVLLVLGGLGGWVWIFTR